MIKNIIRKIITVLLITFSFSFYLFSQSNRTILTYSEYMGKIESIIPEMKLTASVESNAYNNLIKAKSSGDVKFDLQAGAIGMQNHFNQYSILPESDFHYNGFRVAAGFSGLIPYSGTRWSVEIRHDGYFNSFSSMTNLNYFVGLMFSYPIGGRDSKAKMMDAYVSLNAVLADYERANRDFEVQIGIYFDEFQSYKKMTENKKWEINSIVSRINTQNEKFKQGRLPIDEIINTRLELSKARGELLNLEYSIIATIMDYNSLVLLK